MRDSYSTTLGNWKNCNKLVFELVTCPSVRPSATYFVCRSQSNARWNAELIDETEAVRPTKLFIYNGINVGD